MEPNQPSTLFDMQADGLAQNRMNTISKWSKFIAITGLIVVSCSVLVLIGARQKIAEEMSSVFGFNENQANLFLTFVYIFLAFLVVWLVFLLRAAIIIRQGLLAGNSDRVAEGFKALRIYFLISTIFSIFSILTTLLKIF